MEENKTTDKKRVIGERWLRITVIFYILYIAFTWCYRYTYVKPGTYNSFYLNLMIKFLYFPLPLFFISGYLINKSLYYKNNKMIFKMISFIILVFMTVGIGCKYMKYSSFYKNLSDLEVVKTNSYNEEVQDLEKVYVEVLKGKITTKTLYIKTTDFEFIAGTAIATEDQYDAFVEKYKNVKKVRIRYLPTTHILLSIEPADEN